MMEPGGYGAEDDVGAGMGPPPPGWCLRGRCRVGSQRSVNSGDVMRARWRKGEPVIQFSGRWAPNSPHGWGAGPGSPGGTGGQRGPNGAERAGWNHSVRGWEAACDAPTHGPHLRGVLRPDHCAGPSRTAGPPDVSVFRREDVGWWRSWLQQSYQAVKEKVSWASALPPVGPQGTSLPPVPSVSR